MIDILDYLSKELLNHESELPITVTVKFVFVSKIVILLSVTKYRLQTFGMGMGNLSPFTVKFVFELL